MMQVLVNPTNVTLSPSPVTFGEPMCGYVHVHDAVARDNGGEIIGHLMLEVHRDSTRLHMKLKGHAESVTLDSPESIRDAIDALATRLNLAVDWEAMGANL